MQNAHAVNSTSNDGNCETYQPVMDNSYCTKPVRTAGSDSVHVNCMRACESAGGSCVLRTIATCAPSGVVEAFTHSSHATAFTQYGSGCAIESKSLKSGTGSS